MQRHPRHLLVAAIAAAALIVAGCASRFEKGGGPPPDAEILIRSESILPQKFRETFSAAAVLLPNEMVEIKSEAEGRIVEINFEEGAPVEKGRILFRIDDGKLRAALAEAEAALELAQSELIRAEGMFNSRTIARAEYDAARSAFNAREAAVRRLREQLEETIIRAPFDGIMGVRLVSPGQVVARYAHLATLVDQSVIKVDLRLPERFISSIRIGQLVEIRVPAWPDRVFEGSIRFISPDVDSATRTVLVRAEVGNTDGALRAGMFARASVVLREDEDALLVPDIAIMQRGDQSFVYVVGEDTRVQLRPVEIGSRVPGRARVISGLAPGDVVVTEGHQKLRPGARTKST